MCMYVCMHKPMRTILKKRTVDNTKRSPPWQTFVWMHVSICFVDPIHRGILFDLLMFGLCKTKLAMSPLLGYFYALSKRPNPFFGQNYRFQRDTTECGCAWGRVAGFYPKRNELFSIYFFKQI